MVQCRRSFDLVRLCLNYGGMKMNRRLLVLVILTAMLLFTACESASGVSGGEDRLLGVCVTTTSTSDFADDDGKVYAVKSEKQEDDGFTYSFEGFDAAYAFLSTEVVKDENKDVFYKYQKSIEKNGTLKITSGQAKDKDDISYTLISDIYLNKNASLKDKVFYVNWVYQDAEGSVYLSAADGLSHGGDLSGFELGDVIAGVSRSGVSKNSIADEPEKIRTEVQANLVIQSPTVGLRFVEMDSDNAVLGVTEYSDQELPSMHTISDKVAYVIVEEEKIFDDDVKVFRRLLSDKEKYLYLVTKSNEDVFCESKTIEIK